MHGRVVEVTPAQDPALESFLAGLHGRELWETRLKDVAWARIDPEKMSTFHNPGAGVGG
ncbi:hypothetical protein GCM10010357_03870 [Streptomyces luteireticuli]|uniref:GNAT family N-acetyltransferase n=1 Tax=Streptomyces luteireticuli TaxID=173858 RepID=A0ABP3I090_9ACTN